MNHLTIAIDGPAGAGKSTIAKIISNRLEIQYVDTGAMYRALTYKLIKEQTDLTNINSIIHILSKTSINFKNNHIYLDNIIVDDEIRNNNISKNVSIVAKIKEVREKLVDIQRELANNKSIVMDGRDIGSFVLPNAKYKFYITASPEERGRRRYVELTNNSKNKDINIENIIEEIKRRDKIDSTRDFAPLIICEDAIVIDTTNITIEEAVEEVIKYII